MAQTPEENKTIAILRATCWKLRRQLAPEGVVSSTIDRQLALAQLEAQVEIAEQLFEANKVLKRINVINFEELALRFDDWLRKTQD
jgi:hypothetical protein